MKSKTTEEVSIMSKFKIAFIGCGAVTKTHYLAASQLENAEVIGVYDKNASRAEDFAKEYGIGVFASMDELLASDADIVGICTPSGLHAPLSIQCLRAGKHVVVEKPLALTEDDCRAILAAEKKSGKICAPISQLRYFDDMKKAKEILDSGKLGRPILCDLYMKYYRKPEYYAGSWRGTLAMDGGGALMNQGIHGIDMMRFLVGEPKTIRGTVRTLVHNIEVEDTAVATVEFENGALGVIEGTTSVNPGYPRKIEIHCEKGSMIIHENRIVAIDSREIDHEPTALDYDSSSDPMNFPYEGHRRQYANLLAALEGKEKLFYNTEDAMRSVQTVLAIYRSSREDRAVCPFEAD